MQDQQVSCRSPVQPAPRTGGGSASTSRKSDGNLNSEQQKRKTGFGNLFKGIAKQVTLETEIDPETVREQHLRGGVVLDKPLTA